mmetsp:Transcript_17480/g.21167  ORF Transcript_17480/g.21167 Transcript_17480/m.21167 type:complete len:261 (+) Transcript_17480:2-784(+)
MSHLANSPRIAFKLLKGLLYFGFLFSLTMFRCLHVLYYTDNALSVSSYSALRFFLFTHVCIQLARSPLRLLAYKQLQDIRSHAQQLEPGEGYRYLVSSLRQVDQNTLWQVNQKLAVLIYINTICIFVCMQAQWLLFAPNQTVSLEDYEVVASTGRLLVALSLIRLVATFVWACYCFREVAREGIDEALLAKLSRKRFDSDTCLTAKCVICLCHYDNGEDIIVLPCSEKHLFHPVCIQSWLNNNKCCPLCMKDISYDLKTI